MSETKQLQTLKNSFVKYLVNAQTFGWLTEVKANTLTVSITIQTTITILHISGDSESIISISSGSSRPPTPFSRPETAAVIQRPKTTTISERAELNMTEEGDETVEGNGLEPIEETLTLPKEDQKHSDKYRRLSKHIAEDDEDILKMKEYMEKNGL